MVEITSRANQPAQIKPLDAMEEAIESGTLSRGVQARDFGAALDRAATAVQEKQSLLATLEQLANTLPLVTGQLSSADITQLHDALSELDDTASLLANQQPSREQLQQVPGEMRTLEAQVKRLQASVDAAWRKRVQAEFSKAKGLAQVLKHFTSMEDLARRMENTAKLGLALEQRSAASPVRQDFEKRLSELQEQERELAEAGTNAHAVQFLLRVVEEKATLADLDPEIREWLAERNALSLFKLRL